MNIKFLGAAGEVTGSAYLIECAGRKILVDCGMHQGKNEKDNSIPFPIPPSTIDAILLTHAHMDHSGRIPLLVKNGFKGKVWATTPTRELIPILWHDSAHLMREDAEWESRKNSRKGLAPITPLYDENDVEAAIKKLSSISYDENIDVLPEISVRYRDAGHIIGSAMLEVTLKEGNKTVELAFSGDIGPMNTVMERRPAALSSADYVIMESTYGDRQHKSSEDTRREFQDVLRKAMDSGGKVLIPSFAVDRAQRILYEICLMQDDNLLPKNVPIYFDSPMGAKTTAIYKAHKDLLSTEIQNYITQDKEPFSPAGLEVVASAEESQEINYVKCAIVIAGSGMCNGGRIVHHLKHGLYDSKNHVIFVGYQAQGTLGRRLIEGQKIARVAGEEVRVQAEIHTINGFSAHGDQNDLLSWVENFKTNPTYVMVHGEPEASEALSKKLKSGGKKTFIPKRGDALELVPGGVQTVIEQHQATEQNLENDAKTALRDIAKMAAIIEESFAEGGNIEPLMPLILSTKTLLETAKIKAGK
ncbi:MAG: MBL fold metallo-hydrolase [Synergistaceae bacterium]|nr:MBL fold metallo-hydrolase [Synergistaceae bacterium]